MLKVDGLDRIAAMLKSPPRARVGILGGSATRRGGVATNATIGAVHEYGDATHPRRSFLRVPLMEHLQKYLEKNNVFSKPLLEKAIRTKSLDEIMKLVGITAEEVVQDAFDTGGFGKWAPWKPGYINNTGMILIDSQQLRNAITSKVIA